MVKVIHVNKTNIYKGQHRKHGLISEQCAIAQALRREFPGATVARWGYGDGQVTTKDGKSFKIKAIPGVWVRKWVYAHDHKKKVQPMSFKARITEIGA